MLQTAFVATFIILRSLVESVSNFVGRKSERIFYMDAGRVYEEIISAETRRARQRASTAKGGSD